MCVDRLEEGLKPACVSACLGNALNFGVIENTPENREQCKTEIPGFPSPEITHPNIRFQQTNSIQIEMTRTDSMPLKYHKQEDGTFRSVVDEKAGKETAWNLKRLSSRENPLVLFTLLTQSAIGAFTLLFFAKIFAISSLADLFNSGVELALLALLFVMQAGGLLLSTMHLGKPWRFYRGFNNLRYSPVSREAFGVALFFTFMGTYSVCTALSLLVDLNVIDWFAQAFGSLAVISAAFGLYFMYCSYRIKARPFWDHWQTACSFAGSVLTIGPMVLALVSILGDNSLYPLLNQLTPIVILGLLVEGIGLWFHARHMNKEQGEGAASHYVQCTTFGKTYLARNSLLIANILGLMLLNAWAPSGYKALFWLMPIVSIIATALVSRALFYILVIPTTMPGAFFWKNKGFEQHAKDVGLTDMPQTGVVADSH